MDQIAVVHVALISLDPELLLDNVVEAVRKHKRGQLRDLTAQPVSDGAEVIQKGVGEFACPLVVNAAGEFLLHRPMLGIAEVVGKVEDKDTAF